MTTFIPEWVKVSGRNVHIKRALNALDDEHVVRRSVRHEACPADLFVQHRVKGWLAVAVDESPFSELDGSQLFETDSRNQFERRLADLQRLGASGIAGRGPIESIVLMWGCSSEQARLLSKEYFATYGVRLVSKEQFLQLGAKLVSGLLTPVSASDEQRLMGECFPEAEIPAVCTTRRFFRRDNSATLGRFFLDQEQEWASKLDLEMPEDQAGATRDFSVRLVNGVAGSGKTLIALNRALLLADLQPAQRLLLLIHNTPIVADIKERLHRAHGGLPPNLEVATFFAWMYKQWRAVFQANPKMPGAPQMVPDLVKHHRERVATELKHPKMPGAPQMVPDLVKHHRERVATELKQSDEQLLDELDFLNESLIPDEAAYLEASRTGRGFALRPKERSQVWALYVAVTDSLRASRLRMWSALPREVCLANDRHEALERYHHILVDEAQFFAPSWFQVVKLSLEPDGQLFLCADPNQGFMKSRLSWKSVGLEVAGRTKKLRRSYRTTRSILEAANSVLSNLGAGDADDYLQPDFDGMEEGSRPVLVYTDSPQDSMDRLTNEVAELARPGGLPLAAALVIYGENVQKFGLYNQLCKRLGADCVWWFNEKDQKKEPPAGYGKDYLRMAYLDSATGLEASIVFLIGIEHLFREYQTLGLDPEEQAERREESARKLYMAMTRAGQRLVVLASQRLPHTIERLFQLDGPADAPSAS